MSRRGMEPGRVQVVDDEPANRLLLRAALEQEGHDVVEATCGSEALGQAQQVNFDAILLDVMMPEMNGFEVCRRLKQQNPTRPVILVTALVDRAHRLQGILAGADEYLTKPVDTLELVLRVGNAVALGRAGQRLRDSLDELRRCEAAREQLTQMLVHDLRAPLTAVIGSLTLLEGDPGLRGPSRELVGECRVGAERLRHMVSAVLDLSRERYVGLQLQLTRSDPMRLTAQVLAALRGATYGLQVRISGTAPELDCDAELIGRVLANLLLNAIRFSPPGGLIEMRIRERAGDVEWEICDQGPGLDPQHQVLAFTPFGQAPGTVRNHSSGLGLTFCKLAVERHGGEIGLGRAPGGGCRAWFSLPGHTGGGECS